ncbi:MAG: hypothetical protein V1775_00510 [Bacteroidota bacterium]
MLRLKIGNTMVDTRDLEIPVILRSPVFSDGKGSYIFSFPLPATDSLKIELDFFHRPGRFGPTTIKKPLELHFGALYLSGTATIIATTSETYEISCPINNGDLASLFKTRKLPEIDLGGNRIEPDLLRVSASISEVMYYNITDIEFFTCEDTVYFNHIESNPYFEMHSTGRSFTASISCQLILTFNTFASFDSALTELRVKLNNENFDSFNLANGAQENFVPVNVVPGDLISWTLYNESIGGREFTIRGELYIGSKVQISKQETAIMNGTLLYPHSDYAVFPLENPNFLDNLEDFTYAIDNVSAKEIYSQYFPVINYYKDDHFPAYMTGTINQEVHSAFNLFCQFPYLAYVINKIADQFGLTIENNVFEDIDLRQLVVFNLFAENNFISTELIKPKEGFNLADHVPNVLISDYWINLCKLLGIAFDFDSYTKILRLKYLRDIAIDQQYHDFPGMIISEPKLKAAPYKGFRLKQEVSGDEYISKKFKSLVGLNFKGSVTVVNRLYQIVDPAINDCYYVNLNHEYFIWNYDKDLAVLNWIFHSKDFFFEFESIDEDLEGDVLEITTNINAIMNNGWSYQDRNICSAYHHWWLIPVTGQAGNFDGLPGFFKTEFSKSLLYYHGMHRDSFGMLYPFASSDIYNFEGHVVSFGASPPYPAYSQSLSLRWDGPNGLYEKRVKHWLNILMKSSGYWTFSATMTAQSLSEIDFFKWYSGPGFRFLIKEIKFNITQDGISLAELEVLIK